MEDGYENKVDQKLVVPGGYLINDVCDLIILIEFGSHIRKLCVNFLNSQ